MKLLLLISALSCGLAFSQNLEIQLNEISKKEIIMQSYEEDKNAEAVVLFDKGKSIFIEAATGYDIYFERHKRIKVFKSSENNEFAKVAIPYYVDGYGRTEIISSIEAVTYNDTDGNIIGSRLDPDSVHDRKLSEEWRVKEFVFPNIKNGSVLEYRYKLESPFHFNLPDWEFQSEIPTVHSEYIVELVPFYEYVFIATGISRFDFQSSVEGSLKRVWGDSIEGAGGATYGDGVTFKDVIHTYAMSDVPAFKDEAYLSSKNDYLMKLDFQLAKIHRPDGTSKDVLSTWPELNKELYKSQKFGKYIKSSSKWAKKILSDDLQIEGMDKRDKSKAIIDFVKENYKWNGFHGKYASQSAREFHKTKRGNTAEINLFMIALLLEAKIMAEPVILSTRNHGKIAIDYPFDHFTNYVIASVGVKAPFLADATEKQLPYNRIPAKCYNGKALVVERWGRLRWIDMENEIPSVINTNIVLAIDSKSQNAQTQVSIQKSEYDAFLDRSNFSNDLDRIQAYYEERVGKINKVQCSDNEKVYLPYSLYFESNHETEKIDKTITIKPLLSLPLGKNQLHFKERNYPVDFVCPRDSRFQSTLTIPDGYRLDKLPKNYKLDNSLVNIDLVYSLEDKQLKVIGNYQFKRAVYDPSVYSKIRKYIDVIVEHFNQVVILEPVE